MVSSKIMRSYYNYEHRKAAMVTLSFSGLTTDRLTLDRLRPQPAIASARQSRRWPPPRAFRDPQIEMAHGAGGKASRKLVEGLFAPLLYGATPGPLGDAAHVDINGTTVAITN